MIPPDTLLASAECRLVEFYSSDIDLVGRAMRLYTLVSHFE